MISIIIVNYKTAQFLKACLASIKRFVKVPYEVIVVDNSNDIAIDDLPWNESLRLLRQTSNLGFAKACNIGARESLGTVLHFLNPDCEVRADIQVTYDKALASRARCIYVTKVVDGDDRPTKISHALPTLKNVYSALFAPPKIARWYIGASLVMPVNVFREIGGFSEDYFMYAEDMDLFYKAYLAGVPTLQAPSVVVHHQGGASKTVWSKRERLARVEGSAAIFTQKYGLKFDYFVFKHLGFLTGVRHQPQEAFLELRMYWRQLLIGTYLKFKA